MKVRIRLNEHFGVLDYNWFIRLGSQVSGTELAWLMNTRSTRCFNNPFDNRNDVVFHLDSSCSFFSAPCIVTRESTYHERIFYEYISFFFLRMCVCVLWSLWLWKFMFSTVMKKKMKFKPKIESYFTCIFILRGILYLKICNRFENKYEWQDIYCKWYK